MNRPEDQFNTLAYLRDQKHTIHADCVAAPRECSHSAKLSLDGLIDQLGPWFDFYKQNEELRRRLSCARCGRHWPQLTYATYSPDWGQAGSHGVSRRVEVPLRSD
jgi:hypothetical protein